MSNQIKIDQFLKYMANIFINNKDIDINSNIIYSQLSIYGLSKEELNDLDIRNDLYRCYNDYIDNANLDVYFSKLQPNFLQLENKMGINSSCIKIYVTFKKEKMYESIRKIFDFISMNDMSTLSKVFNRVRSDSVVIRLPKESDARKVIGFINNDSELVNDSKETNPFLLKNGIVGIAYDDIVSYNDTISIIISKYLIEKRNLNELNKVSFEEFNSYIVDFYKDSFDSNKGLRNFFDINEFNKKVSRFDSIGDFFLNYRQVFETIIFNLNNNNLDDYFKLYDKFLNEKSTLFESTRLQELYDGTIDNSYSINQVEIVENYVRYANLKYGDDAIMYMYNYLNGDINSITRDNSFRSLFMSELSPEIVLKIMKNDVDGYYEKYKLLDMDNNSKLR